MIDYQINVWAMRRSGIHAITSWLRTMANPLRGSVLANDQVWPWQFLKDPVFDPPRLYDANNVGMHMMTWEDQTVDQLTKWRLLRWAPEARFNVDVVLVRDPFNWAASRLEAMKCGGHWAQVVKLDEDIMARWWEWASMVEYLMDNPRHGVVPIVFNEWFTNSRYREERARWIVPGLQYRDGGVHRVSHHGGGSSFNGTEYDGNTKAMKVLDRWQRFRNNTTWKRLCGQEEVRRIAHRLFGMKAEDHGN